MTTERLDCATDLVKSADTMTRTVWEVVLSHTCVIWETRSFIHSFICSFIHISIHSFIHSYLLSFIHELFIDSCYHSFIYSLASVSHRCDHRWRRNNHREASLAAAPARGLAACRLVSPYHQVDRFTPVINTDTTTIKNSHINFLRYNFIHY